MSIEVKDIPKKLTPLLAKLKKALPILFIVFVLGLFGFLLFRINSLYRSEPSPSDIDEKIKSSGRPRIDQDLIDRIQALRGQNVKVETLFQQARDNPFLE